MTKNNVTRESYGNGFHISSSKVQKIPNHLMNLEELEEASVFPGISVFFSHQNNEKNTFKSQVRGLG